MNRTYVGVHDWMFKFLLPVLGGTVAFLIVVGAVTLDVRNIAWLQGGDPTQHYLSWAFYRDYPWEFPVGLNHNYGLELSSSIVFSDSIPLLAIPFKLFASWLPHPFQYSGLWLFACFVLQAWLASLLGGVVSDRISVRLFTVVLLLFNPAFLWRLSGHYSLCGHWLLLSAIYLYLTGKRRSIRMAWVGLAAMATLVHLYLLVMVLAIWLADLARRIWSQNLQYRLAGAEVAIVLATSLLLLWQAGGFSTESYASWGFGYYRMNVLSPIDASGWSYLLPDIPEDPGDYEGFNFFGLGGLIVSVAALFAIRKTSQLILSRISNFIPLMVALFLLAIFAVSNTVAVADHDFTIPIPAMAEHFANIFRSSGRMFWPVTYCILLLAIWVCTKAYRPRTLALLFGIVAAAQVVDTSAGWIPVRDTDFLRTGSEWTTPLRSPFWEEAAGRYGKVRAIPVEQVNPNFESVSYFASRHGMGSDVVYLARLTKERAVGASRQAERRLGAGDVEQDTLYVLGPGAVELARGVKTDKDLLEKIDGVWVFAPQWHP